MNYACLGFDLQLVKFLKNQRECGGSTSYPRTCTPFVRQPR